MLQSFEAPSARDHGPARLSAMRNMLTHMGVDGFLIPRADVHQGEYVTRRDARLAWLTGFTGSAGFCAVLPHIAGVFIDGRYRVQVTGEVADVFTPVHWPEVQLADWLKEQLPNGGTVGFDPWLHTITDIATHRSVLAKTRITLSPQPNAVDRIWENQPPHPMAPFTAHPITYAGEDHASKRHRLAKDLDADACLLTLPDSIAWLLNIRGTDIARNPVPHAFAVLDRHGRLALFARDTQASGVKDHLGPDVILHPWDGFSDYVAGLTGRVQLDPATCPAAIEDLLRQANIIHANDPCALPKACKNAVEIQGARDAHQRDAVAMVRFLAWLDAQAAAKTLTEIDVVTALEAFRRDTGLLRDIAFDTIAGAGPHGAIVHYRVNTQTNRDLIQGMLLLVDSGGQYHDGTTDITRTMTIGPASDEYRQCYTRVLRGMIAISMAQFPKGVAGAHLDVLARMPLWQAGQDYDHGTGHGVGSYLSVHEGPQGISRRSQIPLEPGMILSNEPGYYREGAFGIRIENLIVVQPAAKTPDADNRHMYQFETLTHVPFDRRLIDTAALTKAEHDWIDQYHAATLQLLTVHIDGTDKDWLIAACAPL